MNAKVPVVFVASASEGLNVVEAAQRSLQSALGGDVEVRPWSGEFQLTRTYIESLERMLDESDFAVLVFTPDDRTKSRGREHFSPRDNVVFELGLFFGRLGRERCFLVQRRDLDLKVPSDLLGIEPATFVVPSTQDLDSALVSACGRIASAIRHAIATLPSRPKFERSKRASQDEIRRLSDRIAGTWWERIRFRGERHAISFLEIEEDDVYNSVRLTGKAYDADGVHAADWRSAAARLEAEPRRLVYVRECRRFDAATTAWLPGLAEVAFRGSIDAINQGDGKFWESEESHPEQTLIKSVELRRSHDPADALTMNDGTTSNQQALAASVLSKW